MSPSFFFRSDYICVPYIELRVVQIIFFSFLYTDCLPGCVCVPAPVAKYQRLKHPSNGGFILEAAHQKILAFLGRCQRNILQIMNFCPFLLKI